MAELIQPRGSAPWARSDRKQDLGLERDAAPVV